MADITAGIQSSLILLEDGSMDTWMTEFAPFREDMNAFAGVIQMAGCLGRAMACNADGEIRVWGISEPALTTIPEGLSNVVDVALGLYHNVAIVADPSRPQVISAPWTRTVYGQQEAEMKVVALGMEPLAYQWSQNGIPISGATNASYLIDSCREVDSGIYSVHGQDAFDSVESSPFELTVYPSQPTILVHPEAKTEMEGEPVTLGVLYVSPVEVGFQWFKDDEIIAGATNQYLRFWGLSQDDEGLYSVLITNRHGQATSVDATLQVEARGPQTGQVIAWGNNQFGQIQIPIDIVDAVAVAGGDGFSMVLRSDGTLLAWGENPHGAHLVPDGLNDVTAIDAESGMALALRRDGTVVAWGRNHTGQTNVPPDLSNIVAIATSGFHNLALRRDGSVVGWGRNTYGESSIPERVQNVVKIAAGGSHSLALNFDGTLTVWGAAIPAPISCPTA